MKPLILLLLCLLAPQKPSVSPELKRLRDEFVTATKDYKANLNKLLAIYEGNVTRAEEKLELSRKLLSEGQISRTQFEENERSVGYAKDKVEETKRQMVNADKQIADALDDSKLQQEYKQAVQQRRRARKPRCSNWTLSAYQRTTSNSVAFGYKIVCQN